MARKSTNRGYQDLILLFIVAVMLVVLFNIRILEGILTFTTSFGIISEILAGLLYSSALSSAFAVFMIVALAKAHSPLEISIFAGIGAMLTDLLIFLLFKLLYFSKHSPLHQSQKFTHLVKILRKSHSFNILAPIIGILIIASPLPDEFGLAILGLSKLNYWVISLITFILNGLGIYIIANIAKFYL